MTIEYVHLFITLLLLCSCLASASVPIEKKCKAVKMCVFILEGDKAKKSRIEQTVERANDIWKQPSACISFEADYKMLDPKKIMFPPKIDSDGNKVEVTLASLLVNGGLKIGKPSGSNNGEILDANGQGTGVIADDVLDALDKEAKKQQECTKDSDGKSPIRSFPIKGIDSATRSGLGNEGKDEKGAITCDNGHFWNACADHAGTTLAHEIGHNLGLRHPKKNTPEDTENNVAQEDPVSRDSSQCEYYTERPSFTEAQKKCACAVIEKCFQFEEKPCPSTRWDRVRCDLEPIKEKYDPLLEELQEALDRLSDESDRLFDEMVKCKGLIEPTKAAQEKATAVLEEACKVFDEFVCNVEEELAEYKSLKDSKKLNKEQRDRRDELKKKYKQLVKDYNKGRKKAERFPQDSIDKEEVAETLAKNADDDKKDDVYEDYRGLRDAKATAEANVEKATKDVKEIEDKLKRIQEETKRNEDDRKEAIKDIQDTESKMGNETGAVTDESGIEVY